MRRVRRKVCCLIHLFSPAFLIIGEKMINLRTAASYISLESPNGQNSTSKLSVQILVLQVFYYVTGAILISITAALLGYDYSLGWTFSWSLISLENSLGLTLFVIWLLDSLFCVVFITFIIGRSKLAWDFAITIHVFNLIIVSLINGFPYNKYWWLLQITSSLLMVVLGTYTTRWRELRDTFFEGLADQELGQARPIASGAEDRPAEESIPLKNLAPV